MTHDTKLKELWYISVFDRLHIGIYVPAAVGGIGGDVIGSDFEGDGHVYG